MLSTFPIRLDYYQYAVETWINIYKEVDFSNIHTILDICPGWSPKLELALIKTPFSGTLYTIDKSEENLDCLENLLDPFPRKFTVKTVPLNIFKDTHLLKQKGFRFDLVLANHIVDDLILDLFLENNTGEPTEADIFANPKVLKGVWNEILKDKRVFENAGNKLKNVLNIIVNPGGLVLMAQYLGYQESLYQLNKVFEKCKNTTSYIKTSLIKDKGFIEDKELPTRVFSSKEKHYFNKEDLVCLRRLSLPE